jgi:predicted nuclease with TOPRIM domain
MNKTRVDDMLIEMISPKVKEIEEKFSKGQGLTLEDINTLLLKSQYNHIYHLDDKLNEVVEDNAKIRVEFESRFSEMELKFEKRFAKLENSFAGLETKFEQSQVKMQETIINTMKWYIGGAGVVLIMLKALDIFIK